MKADFDSVMPRNDENIQRYVSFVASVARDEELRPVDRSGVAAIVEEGARLASHGERLSTLFSEVAGVTREADYWTALLKKDRIDRECWSGPFVNGIAAMAFPRRRSRR